MIRLRTIDAHAGGDPLRLIVDGFPAPRGSTMAEKREWAARRADRLRRVVLLEPRGHRDMQAAVLTEPTSTGSHAGLLFLDADGFRPMSGHGVIAVTTIALERGLLMPGGDGSVVVFDTPAGIVRARATLAPRPDERAQTNQMEDRAERCRVDRVTVTGVPSFVMYAGMSVKLGTRTVRVDVAFGGAFYAIVDSEAAGLGLASAYGAELRRAGRQIRNAIDASHPIAHPLDAALRGMTGTIFTGPPEASDAHMRSVAVVGDGQLGRSPSGTGTAALMAVLHAMGLLDAAAPFVNEGIIGTRFIGRLAATTAIGDYPAIVPEVEGSAWITGEHTWLADQSDPLLDGFRI